MNGARELSAIQPSLVASLHFLARDPKYDTVKPYTVRFDPKGKFPHTNIQNVKHDVKLFNLRPVLESPSEQITWDRHGFQVIRTHNDMTYEDFNNEHILGAVHIPHVLSRLHTKLRAKNVYFLNHMIRKRDSTFPFNTGQRYGHRQPSSRVHIDFTLDGARKILKGKYGDEATAILDNPWQAVNVWQPTRGPCVDWPLALCDASSVDFLSDTMASDIVDPWGYTENMQVHYNNGQRWYYLKDQMPNELLVFKCADSEEGKGSVFQGVPHGSFDNPKTTAADLPRESLELRVLVTF